MTKLVPPPPQRPRPPGPQWIQPGEHLRKADEYIAKADEMADRSGINIETMSRLGVLARLAQVHVDIARAKRST